MVYEAELIFGRFDRSVVREAPANYVAFGNGVQVPEPVGAEFWVRPPVTRGEDRVSDRIGV